MLKKNRWLVSIIVVFSSALSVSTSFAEEVLTSDMVRPDVSFTGTVTLVSDYIWRGQSQTWGKPALQVGGEASHISGFYGGLWVSNVSDQWVPGGHVETDWYAGFRQKLPGKWSEISYDLNVLYVFYPGGDFDKAGFEPRLKSSRPDAIEVYGALTYQWLTLKTGGVLTDFYGWNTNNSPVGAFAGDPRAGVTGSTNGSWFTRLMPIMRLPQVGPLTA